MGSAEKTTAAGSDFGPIRPEITAVTLDELMLIYNAVQEHVLIAQRDVRLQNADSNAVALL